MAQVKKGDTVRVHYTGKLDDGKVFDSSVDGDALEFTVGKGQLIAGFEKAVNGMSPGDSVTVKIPADEAYGPHRPEMVTDFDRDRLPGETAVKVGQRLQLRQKDGQSIVVKVTGLSETALTVDANHELAGKDLTFEIQVVEIVS